MTKKQAAPKQTETVTENAEAQVQLTLQDLILAANIINVVSQRGAIKAEEMETVGAFYNKLVSFLRANGVKSADEQAAEDSEEAKEGKSE